MCTNYAITKNDGTAKLADQLLVDENNLIFNPDVRPGAQISIITGGQEDRAIKAATWWLYLTQTETGLKPHRKYFSVNTNHAKLKSKPEFRNKRCIIPATAFVESQNGTNPHLLEPDDSSAIAFGGLWKEWKDEATDEIIYSASIITLPGHPALAGIHRKSTPLWLAAEDFEHWLSPDVTHVTKLDRYITPVLQTGLRATLIDKATSKKPLAEPFIVR